MVYPLKLPMKDSTITFQIFDKDILSIDDFISETTLDFQHLAQEAFENDSAMKLYQNDSIVANSRKAMTDAINNINFDALKNSNEDEQKEKKKTVASNEKVEILLQNAKKEGYVLKYFIRFYIFFRLVCNERCWKINNFI